jgi:molecular chaperone DnaK
MYVVGIDLGTTFTAAAVWRDGHAEIASLGSRAAVIPSVVLLRDDEAVLTGETANRRGVTEPHRVAREFKRRLGDTTPILLGGSPYSAESLMGRLLRAVVGDVSAREGGPPAKVGISHPANWGPYKRDLLEQAVRLADIDAPAVFVSEPEAAAVFYAQQQRVDPGAVVAVYDLGGGTFDAAVLRKTGEGFEILGQPEGIERLGGIDFDAAVFAHVSRALGDGLTGLDEDDPATIAAVARLREECVEAKEVLASDTDVSIPVLLPNIATEVRLTRAELEAMVRPALYSSIEALRRALRSAGVTAEQLHSVLLVGGSSRMPLVSQLVGAELGRPVAVDAHPKHAVALGAAWLASGQAGAGAATTAEAATGGGATTGAAAGGAAATGDAEAHPTTTGLTGPGRRYRGSATVTGSPTDTGGDGGRTTGQATTGSGRNDADQPTTMMSTTGLRQGPPGPPDTGGSGRRLSRPLMAAAAVLVIAAAGVIGWALADRGGAGDEDDVIALPSPGTSVEQTDPALPPDEQCTDEIRANQRWVCLTSATFDGSELVIEYDVDWAGSVPTINGGFHLHVYGGDGTAPPGEIMGNHFQGDRGSWRISDQDPVRLSAEDVERYVGDAPKVCARIADGNHHLVEAEGGGYTTGNCVRIDRG